MNLSEKELNVMTDLIVYSYWASNYKNNSLPKLFGRRMIAATIKVANKINKITPEELYNALYTKGKSYDDAPEKIRQNMIFFVCSYLRAKEIIAKNKLCNEVYKNAE